MTINRKLQFFASRSLFGYRLCALASVCLFLIAPLRAPATINIPALPKDKKVDKKEAPLPPQPVPVAVQVLNGGTVQITLRVYGKQEQTTRFLIRKEPGLGKIVSFQPAGEEIWVLTYQHTAPLNGALNAQDRILFAAQNDKGTSSPAEILLNIVDAPPQLDGPAPIDFGEIAAGLPAAHNLVIANAGGGILEGTLSVEAPWTVTPATYSLRRGERLTLRVGITPGDAVDYKGRLRFSSNPEAQAPLHARASTPFVVQPDALELTGTATRSGTLTLLNRTAAELRVGITGPERLHLPKEILLHPRGTVPLPLALTADDPDRLDASLRFVLGALSRTIPVHAVAIAPHTASPSPAPAASPAPVASATPAPTAQPSPSPFVFVSSRPSDLPAPEPLLPESDDQPPAIHHAKVLRATAKGEVAFAWDALPSGEPRYAVEIRRIALDSTGELAQRWIPVPGVRVNVSGGIVTGAFDGVPAGVRETARVTAFAGDQPIARSQPFLFTIPPRTPLLTGRQILLAILSLGLAAALAALWKQKRGAK